MNEDQIKIAIESTIGQIESEFRSTQGMILTEDDLKCRIYATLSENHPSLVEAKETSDQHVRAPMLHTELSWYDENGKLTIKPDITILDPRYLSIISGEDGIKLPSKQYSFRGDAVLMELKFIRRSDGIIDRDLTQPTTPPLNTIKADVEKIKGLFSRLEHQGAPYDLFCYFVVFNKTDKRCPKFDKFLRETNYEGQGKYKMIYATGNVELKNK